MIRVIQTSKRYITDDDDHDGDAICKQIYLYGVES